MKKMILCVTALLLVAALFTACGGAKAADLKAVMTDINSKFSFGDLKQLEDTDALNRYYQISADSVKQFAAELSTAASQYTEVILVEGTDAAAADDIAAKLKAHRDAQLSNAKSYDAEQVSMLESCDVQQNGNFVWLVIGSDHDAVTEIINAALK